MIPGSVPTLTKSQFVRGLDCVRRAWLDLHRPELRPPLTEYDRDRMETGVRVGELARRRYPEGHRLPAAYGDHALAAALTEEAIADGRTCLFEATVASEGRVARLDVLRRDDAGWSIDEVKSSSLREPEDLKPDKVMELAFQVRTARRAGLDVAQARLILVDTGYVWPGGEYDPFGMLGAVELTQTCDEQTDQVDEIARNIQENLSNPELPGVETNVHCKRCDYFDHCHRGISPRSVLFLTRVRALQILELRDIGVERIEQIPDDFPLTEPQRRQRDVLLRGKPIVGEGLAEALDAMAYPAAFVDYETSNPAFPLFAGTRPYRQVCFQWSAHVLSHPGADPVHFEFLAPDACDPREAFCRTLWEVVKDAASIVHYTDFEIVQLRAMEHDDIPLAAELLATIEARSVDLHRIVYDHVCLEEFGGRTSIKVVLPALCPSMSYEGMAIAEGAGAALAFRRLHEPDLPPREEARLRRALLDYCRQDTLAMVEIYRALRVLAKARERD
ncbi:MAG: DUF2779 domain-containing protein [Fimbriimonadaceae bacterium]|nr:DUF2779 domain-containing protein [Fimbriimonadaceae bacterium]